MMDFFDIMGEVFGEAFLEAFNRFQDMVSEIEVILLDERELDDTAYKPKWKPYLRDRRLKIHRIRSTI